MELPRLRGRRAGGARLGPCGVARRCAAPPSAFERCAARVCAFGGIVFRAVVLM